MLSTIETRWFGQGATPGSILDWFDVYNCQAERQPRRRDYYLQPVSDSGLSVKLREGGLEVKQRQKSYGPILLNRSVEGLVERWFKWRFPLQESFAPLNSVQATGQSWMAVDKERLLKWYQVGATGSVQAVPFSTAVSAGCQVELATIWSSDSRWWTVAFEADGEGSGALDRLLEIANRQFAATAPVHFSAVNSFGYPRWLAAFPKEP